VTASQFNPNHLGAGPDEAAMRIRSPIRRICRTTARDPFTSQT